MKRIFIYIILILCVTTCKSKVNPSKINIEIPKNEIQTGDNLNSIEIRIDSEGNYYLNKNQVIFDAIIRKIDSLGELGFNSSRIIIRADKEAKVSATIKIMELANNNNKKVKLGTALN